TWAVRVDDRRIVMASETAPKTIAFDLYRIDLDAWEALGETSPQLFDHPDENRNGASLDILGGTALGEEVVVFIQFDSPHGSESPARGIRVNPSGSIASLSMADGPAAWVDEAAIHGFGNRI